jgi:NTE family protein
MRENEVDDDDDLHDDNEDETDTPINTLIGLLRHKQFALSISPGFFRYYCYIGILHALEDMDCLHPTHISGSSAGALVGGFLAAGIPPSEMKDMIFAIRREHMWDLGMGFGLLRGHLFQNLLEKHLPVGRIEDCPIPFGTTAWDVCRFRTNVLHKGNIATAIRASCTFPVLFQPAWINGWPHIDGG